MRDTETADDRSRQLAFAAFVTKALRDAQALRGWSNVEVAAQSGVGRATIDRWKHGRWVDDPEPAKVNAFCEALGASLDDAYGALGWGRYSERQPEASAPMHPAIEALLRKLHDPNVSDEEKREVIRHVEWLASRPTPPEPPTKGRTRRVG